jgi:hypothetical protein
MIANAEYLSCEKCNCATALSHDGRPNHPDFERLLEWLRAHEGHAIVFSVLEARTARESRKRT